MTTVFPITTLFAGILGLLVVLLSCIVADERAKNRVWHGSNSQEAKHQPDYLKKPNDWAAFIERLTKSLMPTAKPNPELLQRKIRAHANFCEYTPMVVMILLCLESMGSGRMVWILGATYTIARIAHAYGLIMVYGPSIGRAIGYFGTLGVLTVGSGACVNFALQR